MNKNNSIIGINLIVLFISVSTIHNFDEEGNYSLVIYCVSIIALAVSNIAYSAVCFYREDMSKAKSFILSALVVLIIGGSSCVSIKFRNKEPKPKQTIPITDNNKQDTLRLKQK